MKKKNDPNYFYAGHKPKMLPLPQEIYKASSPGTLYIPTYLVNHNEGG